MNKIFIEDEEDIKAAMVAQALTVEQQNYRYSTEARDRTILRLKEPSKRVVAEIAPEIAIAVEDHVEANKRRGRGLYGLHARRNRLAS